jgi:hypothetical protein
VNVPDFPLEGVARDVRVTQPVVQSLAAVSELKVAPRERVELVLLVDDYVFGFTRREILQEIYVARVTST